MNYKFPHITNISQVLAAIQGRPEFIVAEKSGDYTVINYMVSTDSTFPPVGDETAAILRECRGIIFDSRSGDILRRPFHKFWNLNEREETQIGNIDFSLPHDVYTKLDGSMISPFEMGKGSGVIRFGTKMGVTDVGIKAEAFIAQNPKYMDFSKWCISQDITPIFEFTAPDNQIVIKYDAPMMTLLAARHMISGEYLHLKNTF